MTQETQPQLSSLVVQLMLTAQQRPQSRQRFNPRPPGVIRSGSATDAVMSFLLASSGFKTHAQICWATKRSHSAVSWALIRLRQWGKVVCTEDAGRNSRYLKYSAVRGGK